MPGCSSRVWKEVTSSSKYIDWGIEEGHFGKSFVEKYIDGDFKIRRSSLCDILEMDGLKLRQSDSVGLEWVKSSARCSA